MLRISRAIKMVCSPLQLHRYEELTLNSSPASREIFVDGWVVRASGSAVWRSNSASCLNDTGIDFAETYDAICAWYRSNNQVPQFRISPLAPESVDTFLADRGYVRDTDTLFMTASIGFVSPGVAAIPCVRLIELSLVAGLEEVHRWKRIAPAVATRELERQAQWLGAQRFMAVKKINGTAAVGLARIEGPYVGIFNMQTAEAQRGKGYATLLLDELLVWAKSQGARHAFLQVEQANTNAVALYKKFGFRSQYLYWHRIKLT